MQNCRARSCRISLADVKARQASKIREIGKALITAGFVSLDAQAKVLGLPLSTAWRILSAEHKMRRHIGIARAIMASLVTLMFFADAAGMID